jgi:hypothetical protein
MMIRFATVVAFGRRSLIVERADMEWARKLVLESAEGLHQDVLKYTVDMQDFPGVCQRILELAVANFADTKDRFITRRDINRGCQNFLKKGGDLDVALKHLVQAERLRFEQRQNPKGGPKSVALCCANDEGLVFGDAKTRSRFHKQNQLVSEFWSFGCFGTGPLVCVIDPMNKLTRSPVTIPPKPVHGR